MGVFVGVFNVVSARLRLRLPAEREASEVKEKCPCPCPGTTWGMETETRRTRMTATAARTKVNHRLRLRLLPTNALASKHTRLRSPALLSSPLLSYIVLSLRPPSCRCRGSSASASASASESISMKFHCLNLNSIMGWADGVVGVGWRVSVCLLCSVCWRTFDFVAMQCGNAMWQCN